MAGLVRIGAQLHHMFHAVRWAEGHSGSKLHRESVI
jgi:hypothetical protein